MKNTVLGIDCGLATTGWAIVEKAGNVYEAVSYGVVKTNSRQKLGTRLQEIYNSLSEIVSKYKPKSAGIESLFYFKNQKTVMVVGQARGVTLLALADKKLQTYDYTPLQVKQAVTGYGKAEKAQVQIMVKRILKLKEMPKPDDAADALAVAVCHLNSLNNTKLK
ncbi:MAG: crossover junction endodeoxyribonuclease RuvC [Candidatus Dojkabacteria bacterium]|nr:crossover junction endodeoxyribonuclease RuvC [Candidatus Dojkabacteria bacterium]